MENDEEAVDFKGVTLDFRQTQMNSGVYGVGLHKFDSVLVRKTTLSFHVDPVAISQQILSRSKDMPRQQVKIIELLPKG